MAELTRIVTTYVFSYKAYIVAASQHCIQQNSSRTQPRLRHPLAQQPASSSNGSSSAGPLLLLLRLENRGGVRDGVLCERNKTCKSACARWQCVAMWAGHWDLVKSKDKRPTNYADLKRE